MNKFVDVRFQSPTSLLVKTGMVQSNPLSMFNKTIHCKLSRREARAQPPAPQPSMGRAQPARLKTILWSKNEGDRLKFWSGVVL